MVWIPKQQHISDNDAKALFLGEDAGLLDLIRCANEACEKKHGNQTSFVVNRNINFTNICQFNCRFCAFHVSKGDPAGYMLSVDEVAEKTRAAKLMEPTCTEICIQGGLHPDLTVELIESYLHAIKSIDEEIHVHGFSPQEIWNLAKREHTTIGEMVDRLKLAGLGSVPGTAAEILVDQVRKKICPSKITSAQWVDVITTAHKVGLPSTSTIMYGHIETIDDIVEHFRIIRQVQEKTHGITEFVPLPFQRDGLIDEGLKATTNPINGILDLKLHAIARLYFRDLIDNIQCSWVKLGVKFCQFLLHAGVNDFSGTLMEENISKSAGAMHGEYIPASDMIDIIKIAGRIPVQRSTRYDKLKVFS